MRCWTPLLRHPTRTACFALSLLGSSLTQQHHRLHPRGGLPGSSLILAMAASSGSGSGSGSSGKGKEGLQTVVAAGARSCSVMF